MTAAQAAETMGINGAWPDNYDEEYTYTLILTCTYSKTLETAVKNQIYGYPTLEYLLDYHKAKRQENNHKLHDENENLPLSLKKVNGNWDNSIRISHRKESHCRTKTGVGR